MASTHGWAEIDEIRKREILAGIRTGGATRGPVHAELDLTDRCNVACYFCNQQDVRTTEQVPLERVKEILDELVAGGLKSVRLSGGGDPLAYRGIDQVFDLLFDRGVVVDNLTTNGALLTAELAAKLVVPGRAREVLFSLNAVDAADYHRMMQVKPATFDKVLENAKRLVELRGAATLPKISVQFLIDRGNHHRLAEMYALGRSLGVDRIAINSVLPIPNERIADEEMLGPPDFHKIAAGVERVLREDKGKDKLFLCFAFHEWNHAIEQLREKVANPLRVVYDTAPAYREENGGCFFAWYSATIRGNGDLYPCCMLLNPTYKPLGNLMTGAPRFFAHWNGPAFARLRSEMRDVLLSGSRILFSRKRFEHLEPQCTDHFSCGLKNMYFRGDDAFYRELGGVLEERRRAEIGIGRPGGGTARWWEIQHFRLHHGAKVRLRPLMRAVAKRLRTSATKISKWGDRLARI